MLCFPHRRSWSTGLRGVKCFSPVGISFFWSSASGMSLCHDAAQTYMSSDHTSWESVSLHPVLFLITFKTVSSDSWLDFVVSCSLVPWLNGAIIGKQPVNQDIYLTILQVFIILHYGRGSKTFLIRDPPKQI